jgi:hypothetical protein
MTASFWQASGAAYRVALLLVARLFIHGLVTTRVVLLFLRMLLLLRGSLISVEIVVRFVCHFVVLFGPQVAERVPSS